MAEKKKKVSMKVYDGREFYAHETSVNFSPSQFVLDFKSITPRVDPRSSGSGVVLKHNVVMIDPVHAKKFSEILSSVVEKYEKEFGEIEKSKARLKHEKKLKKKKGKKKSGRTPTYFG